MKMSYVYGLCRPESVRNIPNQTCQAPFQTLSGWAEREIEREREPLAPLGKWETH
jgi:hypothetical protein